MKGASWLSWFERVWRKQWRFADQPRCMQARESLARWFAVLACAAVFAATVWQVQGSRSFALSQARVQGANLAQAIAEQSAGAFSTVEVVLGVLAEHLHADGVPQALFDREERATVERAAAGLSIRVVAAYSAEGDLLAATPPVTPGLPAQLDEHTLSYHRTHTGEALLIGFPQAERGANRRVILISRRVGTAGGDFGGVVVALVDTAALEAFYGGLRLGPHAAIGLLHQDGSLLARTANPASDAAKAAVLQAYENHGLAGSYDVVSPVDGGVQLASLRAVKGYPLTAFVALSQADVLATWRSDALCSALVASLLSCGIGMFGWLLAAQIRRAEECLRAANAELQQTAMQDPLTGIGNRRLFDSVLLKEQRRAARTEQPVALLMIDVDHFKAYNDTYGHPAGDLCLQTVANTIARLAQRPADLAARFGGEEFAVLLPETDAQGAAALAERTREAVRQLHLPHCHGVDGVVTVSIGVAVVWPQRAESATGDIVAQADAALYAAKAQGRNRACASSLSTALMSQSGITAWLSSGSLQRSNARS